MPTGWILVITALNLMAPIVWVALFNFVGLKRIVERLGDLEDDNETMRNKTRSIQSQVSKKIGKSSPDDEDQKVNREIAEFLAKEGDPITRIDKGGIKNAG